MKKILRLLIILFAITLCSSCGIASQLAWEGLSVSYRPGEYIRIREGEYKNTESVLVKLGDFEYKIEEAILNTQTITQEEYIQSDGINVKKRVLVPNDLDGNYFLHKKNKIEYYKLNFKIRFAENDWQELTLRQTNVREDTYQFYLFETTIQIDDTNYNVVLVVEICTTFSIPPHMDTIHLKLLSSDINYKISDRFEVYCPDAK